MMWDNGKVSFDHAYLDGVGLTDVVVAAACDCDEVSGTSKKSLSTFLLEFHVDPFRTKTT